MSWKYVTKKKDRIYKKKIVIFFFSSLFANCSTKTFRMRYKCFAKRKYSIWWWWYSSYSSTIHQLSSEKRGLCLMRYHIFHSKSCHIFGIPKTTISFKKNFVLVLEKIGSMEWKTKQLHSFLPMFLYSKNMENFRKFQWKTSFFLKSIEQNRCHTVPLVFSNQSSCNGGFNQKNCSKEEIIMEIVYYYDWNSEKCHQSIMSLCSESVAFLFQEKFNSFNTMTDCLKGMYE